MLNRHLVEARFYWIFLISHPKYIEKLAEALEISIPDLFANPVRWTAEFAERAAMLARIVAEVVEFAYHRTGGELKVFHHHCPGLPPISSSLSLPSGP